MSALFPCKFCGGNHVTLHPTEACSFHLKQTNQRLVELVGRALPILESIGTTGCGCENLSKYKEVVELRAEIKKAKGQK